MSDADFLRAQRVLEQELDAKGETLQSWARRVLNKGFGPWVLADGFLFNHKQPRRTRVVRIPFDTDEFRLVFNAFIRGGPEDVEKEFNLAVSDCLLLMGDGRFIVPTPQVTVGPPDFVIQAVWIDPVCCTLNFVVWSSVFDITPKGDQPLVVILHHSNHQYPVSV